MYYIHAFDVYLLHVSVFAHCQQGEQLRQFLQKPTTINKRAQTPKHVADMRQI